MPGTSTATSTFVLDGQLATVVYMLANTDAGPGVFAVDPGAAGLERTLLSTVDPTRKQCRLRFADTPARLVGRPGAGVDVFTAALDRSAVGLLSEQAGGARRTVEMASQYAKTRYQFGRAIGSFQAVKHMCADMLLEAESAMSARALRGRIIRRAGSTSRIADLALAQAYCSDAFARAAATNIQVHGGIGFTWEHPAHLYLRRARSRRPVVRASPSWHRERYLRQIGSLSREHDERQYVTGWRRTGLPVSTAPHGPNSSSTPDWAVPSWEPEWFGRGLSDAQSRLVAAEFAAVGAPGTGHDRANLFACTLHDAGTDEQKRRLIPPSSAR